MTDRAPWGRGPPGHPPRAGNKPGSVLQTSSDYQRGASAPPGGECRPTARPGTKLSGGTWGARSEFPGKKTEKDLRAEVPSAAEEAMAVGVWGLRLWRAVPGGGAGWSEF